MLNQTSCQCSTNAQITSLLSHTSSRCCSAYSYIVLTCLVLATNVMIFTPIFPFISVCHFTPFPGNINQMICLPPNAHTDLSFFSHNLALMFGRPYKFHSYRSHLFPSQVILPSKRKKNTSKLASAYCLQTSINHLRREENKCFISSGICFSSSFTH